MRTTSAIAGLAVAALLGGLGVVAASPASAADDGPSQQGNVYFLLNHKNLANAGASDQVTTASYAEWPPFTSVAIDHACPANTAQVQVLTRLRTSQAEAFWNEVPLGESQAYVEDAEGHAYIDTPMETFNLSAIQSHLGGTTGNLPVAFVCQDADGMGTGHFTTEVRIEATGMGSTNGHWTQQNPDMITGGGQTADTTTALTGFAQGANLVLSASVNPVDAAGTMTFSEGGTTLGTETVSAGQATFTVVAPAAGDHTYKALFTPTNPSEYNPSSIETMFNVAVQPDGSIVVTLLVPEAPIGDPGTVTMSVPSGSAITMTGERTTGNTRMTASGALPTITVTDTHRSDLLTSWQVNVQATDFASGSATIGAKYLGLAPALPSTVAISGPPTVVQAGSNVVSYLDDAASKGLSQAQPLGVVATTGQGTTTLGGTLNLAVPGTDAAQGTYTSVITVTLVNG